MVYGIHSALINTNTHTQPQLFICSSFSKYLQSKQNDIATLGEENWNVITSLKELVTGR